MGQHTRLVGYIRVSKAEQAEHGRSLEAQEAALRAYCAARGCDLVELAVDDPATTQCPLAERRGGQRVAALVAAGEVDGVVAIRLDRLFRDCRETLAAVDEWESRGVALHLLDLGGQSLDTSSAMGRFFLTVMAGAAELERGLVSERITETLGHLRDEGVQLGAPRLGQRRTDAVDVHGRQVIAADPAELDTVQRITSLRASGASLRAIATTLQAEGRRPKRGQTWHASTVRGVLRRAA